MTPALTILLHFLLSYLCAESSALYNMIYFSLALSLFCNHVFLKPSSVAKFMLNLSIHNFISFLILHLFPLMIEEYKKRGVVTKQDYILKERPSPQCALPAASFFFFLRKMLVDQPFLGYKRLTQVLMSGRT